LPFAGGYPDTDSSIRITTVADEQMNMTSGIGEGGFCYVRRADIKAIKVDEHYE